MSHQTLAELVQSDVVSAPTSLGGEWGEYALTTAVTESDHRSAMAAYAADMLDSLPASDAELLRLRFGFVDGKIKSYRQLTQILELTDSEVRTRVGKALLALREITGDQ